jgi:hypothetical protein
MNRALGAILASALLVPSAVFAGFGVSPPLIKEDKLVRGIRLDRIVYLVQGDPERDLQVELFVESPVKDWIRFPQGNPVTIPKGVQQFPLAVEVAVPEDADFGVYTGTIRVTTVPEKADTAGEVAISIGGIIDLDLTVGDDVIVDIDVRSIKIWNVKEGDHPEVDITVSNQGNVGAAPDAATFELFNKFGELRLAYAESKEFTPVPAFNERVEHLTFPIDIHLAPGEYWGHVKVYKDNALLNELKTVFNVTEKTLTEAYLPYAPYAGGAVIVLVLGAFLLRRR